MKIFISNSRFRFWNIKVKTTTEVGTNKNMYRTYFYEELFQFCSTLIPFGEFKKSEFFCKVLIFFKMDFSKCILPTSDLRVDNSLWFYRISVKSGLKKDPNWSRNIQKQMLHKFNCRSICSLFSLIRMSTTSCNCIP